MRSTRELPRILLCTEANRDPAALDKALRNAGFHVSVSEIGPAAVLTLIHDHPHAKALVLHAIAQPWVAFAMVEALRLSGRALSVTLIARMDPHVRAEAARLSIKVLDLGAQPQEVVREVVSSIESAPPQ